MDRLLLGIANVLLCARNPGPVRTFHRRTGKLPNLAAPRSYLERMYWRKLIDHNPLFVELTDKLMAKEYCRRVCPELELPRTLWVGSDADEIPDDLLAGDVFVKTNHGFDYNYRVRGGEVDRHELKQTTDRWLRQVHGRGSRQWAYAQVQPRLFVEEAIGDAQVDLLEFSVRASNGQPILGSVTGHNKLPNKWGVALDLEGRPAPGSNDAPGSPPKSLPEGLAIAEPYALALAHTRKLSVGVDYARFDFMWNGSTLYGGEITIYPAAGGAPITHPGVEARVLAGWDLRTSHFLRTTNRGLRGVYAGALRRRLAAACNDPPEGSHLVASGPAEIQDIAPVK